VGLPGFIDRRDGRVVLVTRGRDRRDVRAALRGAARMAGDPRPAPISSTRLPAITSA